MKINTLLIANRGEIACRIIETAKKMGIKTIAVYSAADQMARHVPLADEAYYLGEAPAKESYLNATRLIEIATQAHAQAIHPGYGFLSENAAFAALCEKHHLIFVGPPARAIEAMGNKDAAKRLMRNAGIPVIPGYDGEQQDVVVLKQQAAQIGYPLLIKAAAGGGGKGMRLVTEAKQFEEALSGAKREAKSSFGDETVILEKYIDPARHVEVQIFADKHDQFVHLYTRDCSIQRRHQKMIEEAPANYLPAAVEAAMGDMAIRVAKAIQYENAGTVEFLVDSQHQFYFMEMNTRLQVEHPVTEMITHTDLVEWQLRIAAGEFLPLTQAAVMRQGHAIEVRIYAEDPTQAFMPSVGAVKVLHSPVLNAHVRLDTGIQTEDNISPYYDPMIAKLIVQAPDRAQCIQRLEKALRDYQLIGVKNNIDFLRAIIQLPDFLENRHHTQTIETQYEILVATTASPPLPLLAAACLYELLKPSVQIESTRQSEKNSPWVEKDMWRLHVSSTRHLSFKYQQKVLTIIAEPSATGFSLSCDVLQWSCTIDGVVQKNHVIARLNHQYQIKAKLVAYQQTLYVFSAEARCELIYFDPSEAYVHQQDSAHSLSAPMPGTVTAVFTAVGKVVKTGDSLLTLEAMKMEHTIKAPRAGTIAAIHCQVGERVNEGVALIAFVDETGASRENIT